MAKTFTAAFAQTPKIETVVVTAAGTSTDDSPSNTGLLVTAGADGALVTRISAIPRATVAANRLNLFLSGDGGSTKRLFSSVLMAAHTVANNTQTPQTDFTDITETAPLRLEASERIYVNMQVALSGGVVFVVEFTDF